MRREVSLRLEAVAVEAEMAAAVRAERHRCFAGRAAATIASAWRVAKARRRLAVWVRLRAVARGRVLLPHLDGWRCAARASRAWFARAAGVAFTEWRAYSLLMGALSAAVARMAVRAAAKGALLTYRGASPAETLAAVLRRQVPFRRVHTGFTHWRGAALSAIARRRRLAAALQPVGALPMRKAAIRKSLRAWRMWAAVKAGGKDRACALSTTEDGDVWLFSWLSRRGRKATQLANAIAQCRVFRARLTFGAWSEHVNHHAALRRKRRRACAITAAAALLARRLRLWHTLERWREFTDENAVVRKASTALARRDERLLARMAMGYVCIALRRGKACHSPLLSPARLADPPTPRARIFQHHAATHAPDARCNPPCAPQGPGEAVSGTRGSRAVEGAPKSLCITRHLPRHLLCLAQECMQWSA